MRKWLLAVALALPAQVGAQWDIAAAARKVAQRQYVADQLALGFSTTLVERSSAGEEAFKATPVAVRQVLGIWAVIPQMVSHGKHYLVAELGTDLIELGGFASPRLLELDSLLRNSGMAELPRRIESLAALADPHGALAVFDRHGSVLLASTAKAIDSGTIRILAMSLPDTVVRLGDMHVARVTVASATEGYGTNWRPITYVLTFTEELRLVAWSRRIGPRIEASHR